MERKLIKIDPSKFTEVDISNSSKSIPQVNNIPERKLVKIDPSKFTQVTPKKEYSFFKPVIPQNSPTTAVQDISRLGARVGEQFIGGAGNIASGLLGIGNIATKGVIPTYEQVQEKLPISLPTSEQVRKGTKYLTGEYLEPQTHAQKVLDNFVEDVASYVLPAGIFQKVGAGAKYLKNFGIGIESAAKLAALRGIGGEAARMAGGGEVAQELTKGVLTIGSAFAGNNRFFTNKYKQLYDTAEKTIPKSNINEIPNLKKAIESANNAVKKAYATATKSKNKASDYDELMFSISNQYNHVNDLKQQLENAIPKKAVSDATKLRNTVDSLTEYATSGDKTLPEKKFLIEKLDQVKRYLFGHGNNKIPAEAAWKLKRDFNDQFKDLRNFNPEAKGKFGELIDSLKTNLVDYGKVNKPFGKAFMPAEEIFAGLRGADSIRSFLSKNFNIDKYKKNPLIAPLLSGVGLYAAPKVLSYANPKALAAGTALYGANETVKFFSFLSKSPLARKYYSEVLKNSLAGNVAATGKALNKLNRISEDYQKKEAKNI